MCAKKWALVCYQQTIRLQVIYIYIYIYIYIGENLFFCISHSLTSIVNSKLLISPPHGSDDGSAEPKRYSVDLSINPSFHLDRCYQFFYTLSD